MWIASVSAIFLGNPRWLRALFRSFQGNKVRQDRIRSCQCGEAGLAWGHWWWHFGWFPSRTFSWWLMAAVTYKNRFRSLSSLECPSWWRWTSSSESSFLLSGGGHTSDCTCPKGIWVSRLHLETQNRWLILFDLVSSSQMCSQVLVWKWNSNSELPSVWFGGEGSFGFFSLSTRYFCLTAWKNDQKEITIKFSQLKTLNKLKPLSHVREDSFYLFFFKSGLFKHNVTTFDV